MTKIQQSILEIIQCSDGHQTAEQVLSLVRNAHPSASLSTVYRNLNVFADSGKIRRIERASGADYYERNLIPHDHAYCVQCGSVSVFKVPGLKDYLEQSFKHRILSFELLVNYTCPECLSKQNEATHTTTHKRKERL